MNTPGHGPHGSGEPARRGADDTDPGWGVPPPPPPRQPATGSAGAPYPGDTGYPGGPAGPAGPAGPHATTRGTSGAGKKALIALAVIIPLVIFGAVFAVRSMGGDGESASPTLRVTAADPAAGSRDGSGGSGAGAGPNPDRGGGRGGSSSGGFHPDDLVDIKREPFLGGAGDTSVPGPRNELYGGDVHQVDTTGRDADADYPIHLTFGEAGNTIAYPALGCSGTLEYRGTQGDTTVYEEVITSGQRNCVDVGRWWFRALDEPSTRIGAWYESPDGRWRVSGTLMIRDAP